MKYTCLYCGAPTDNSKDLGGHIIHSCDKCQARILRRVEYQLNNAKWRQDIIVCPHCNHEYSEQFSVNHPAGESPEVSCEACGKKFDLEIIPVRYYSTKKSICEMPKEDTDGN